VGGLLPEQAKRLPTELSQVDAYLDDERFSAPWRTLFDRRLGRPSVPFPPEAGHHVTAWRDDFGSYGE
jgi:hypothetical protein